MKISNSAVVKCRFTPFLRIWTAMSKQTSGIPQTTESPFFFFLNTTQNIMCKLKPWTKPLLCLTEASSFVLTVGTCSLLLPNMRSNLFFDQDNNNNNGIFTTTRGRFRTLQSPQIWQSCAYLLLPESRKAPDDSLAYRWHLSRPSVALSRGTISTNDGKKETKGESKVKTACA